MILPKIKLLQLREQLIKKLDSHIRFVPVLDLERKLISVVSNEFLPLSNEQDLYIRARAPKANEFGGGGSDVTHYFKDRQWCCD